MAVGSVFEHETCLLKYSNVSWSSVRVVMIVTPYGFFLGQVEYRLRRM